MNSLKNGGGRLKKKKNRQEQRQRGKESSSCDVASPGGFQLLSDSKLRGLSLSFKRTGAKGVRSLQRSRIIERQNKDIYLIDAKQGECNS